MPLQTPTSLASAFSRQDHLDRYIVHLRQRRTQRVLNLVLGAGATRDAGTPLWHELIQRLRGALASETKGRIDPFRSFGPAMAAEVLLKWLEAKIDDDADYKKSGAPESRRDDFVNNRWISAIRAAIYKKVPEKSANRRKKHSYLHSLASLVARCPITINFNFDDVIDRATQEACEEQAIELPNIVWRLPFGYQTKGATILHINGYLPSVGKANSERLVLTEGAFAELMLQQTDYQSIALLRAFAESTMLILGCSLEDSSLKAILRSSAQINAANFHYMVHFLSDDDAGMEPHLKKIFEANKAVYNLITIFLKRSEIDGFLRLIASPDASDFEVALKELAPKARTKLLFYIVGAVGCGKTTLIRNLRLFQTHEEWGAPPPREMYRDPSTLSSDEKRAVDSFLKAQLRHKNETMRRADIGFHVMDRGYLDLIAFSDSDTENKKKLEMLETFVAGHDGLQDGVIVMLKAKPDELEASQWARGQVPKRYGGEGYTLDTLEQQQKLLEKIYGPCKLIAAREKAAARLARDVAFSMLTEEYIPMSFSEKIAMITRGELRHLYGWKPRSRSHATKRARATNSRRRSRVSKGKV